MISIDKDIQWKEYYIRNNRTKNQKHIRCFPDHLNGVHKEVGFCGSYIKIFVENLKANTSGSVVVGCFERNGYLYESKLKLGNKYDINMFKYDDESECPFYLGKYSELESVKNNKITFVINSNLTSWRYAETINKSTQIKFKVYLLLKEEENEYKVINEISSPLFLLKSSRHINKNEILCAPINPIIFNETKNIKISPPKEEEDNFLLNLNSPINTESINNNIYNNSTLFPIPSPINKTEKEIEKENNANNIISSSFITTTESEENVNENNNNNNNNNYALIHINRDDDDVFPFEIYSTSPKDLKSYHIKNPNQLPKPIYVIKKNEDKNEKIYDYEYKNIPPPSIIDINNKIEEQLPAANDFMISPLIMNITEPLSPEFENKVVYSPKPAELKSAYEVKIKKPSGVHELCRMVKSLEISNDSKDVKKEKRREEFDFMGRNVYDEIKDDSSFYRQIDSKGNITVHIPMFSISKPN